MKRLMTSFTQLNPFVVDSLTPHQNRSLGKVLAQLIREHQAPSVVPGGPATAHNTTLGSIQIIDNEEKKESVGPAQEVSIPHHLSLKLCLLGRACAGKRTLAKQISESYPAGKVKVFRMEDLIKEVLDYINPKPQADLAAAAAADKNKKAPPAKGGKVEETGPVDPYAGMDTREYKEIGNQIKKFFGENADVHPSEYLSLITDDSLLVNLFIQKLKLTFPQEKSEAAKIEEIKSNLAKEKDILEQLAELEAANAGGDPKAAAGKGAKAPPAKGGKGAAPSGEEQLRADLELATKVQPEGWILIDFPRNLEQAKTFERLMNNGFTPMIDKSKETEQTLFEEWSKLVSPSTSISQGNDREEFNGDPLIYRSAADSYLFVEVASDEVIRRLSQRKIDPTTNTIYHLEDNPPPEGDPKLKDRLQDYHGDADQDHAKLQQLHPIYDSRAVSVKKWATSFGLHDDTLTEGQQLLSLFMEVHPAPKSKREEVLELVNKQVHQVLAFKQAQYDARRQKVRDTIEKEAQAQMNKTQDMGSQHTAQEQAENNAEGADLHNEMSQQDIRSSVPGTQYSKQHSAGGVTGGTRSLASLNHRSQKQIILNDEMKVKLWKEFQLDYYRECLQVFRAIKKQRGHVFEGLTQMQAQFIDMYLARQDPNMNALIQDFIDSYNKFSEEFPNLRQDPQTQIELKKRVTKLSNDIWALLEHKKDQALQQHEKLNSDGWVVKEMKKLVKSAARIIQQELQKYNAVFQIMTGMGNSLELDLERTVENFSDDGAKTIDENGNSPLFDKLFNYVFRILATSADHANQQPDEAKAILKTEIDSVVFRSNLVRTWVLLKMKEFNQFWRQLYEVLDDAILVAIKLENEATQSVVKRVEAHIREVHMAGKYRPMDYEDNRIPYIDLESAIERIDFSGAEVPLYMQNISVPEDPVLDMRLSVSMLDQFYLEFRYHAFEEYLDGQTFIHLILLAFQTPKRVPNIWRYYDFTIFNQMVDKFSIRPPGLTEEQYANTSIESTREFIDWKKLMNLLTLVSAPMPDEQALQDYAEKLSQLGPVLSSQELFAKVPAWFDDFEVKTETPVIVPPGTHSDPEDDEEEEKMRNTDYERLANIKRMLFKINQTNTRVLKIDSFINTLRELTQMAQGYPSFHAYIFGE